MSEELLPRALPLGELLLAAGLLLPGCGGGSSNTPAPTRPTAEQLKATCQSLAGQVIEGVTVTKTTRHEANAAVSSPGFCQVLGTRAPYLDIEIDVPDSWTGRFWQQGGGGFDGQIPSAVTMDAGGNITGLSAVVANKGAVYAASNGGNRANVASQAAPAIWASTSPEGRQSATDYAYAALGTTVHFGKAVTKAFFGTAPSHSYFNGCSNGGRNAYIAAQRWPQEFDGIVSGCETMDMAGQTSAWLQAASAKGSPAAPSAAQTNAAYAAAVSACDALDGVTDQVIANPMACRFDASALQCGAAGASSDPAICLSPPQVAMMKSFFADLKLQNGATVLSGFWWSGGLSQGWELLGGGFALLASGDAAWLTPTKQSAFQLETDYPMLRAGLSQIGADHDRSAIASFVASGRKLISWHGGSDGLLSPADHYRNWAAMAGIAKSKGLADPNTATRFFVVPGATHGMGQSLWEVDWASAIMAWVEEGAAPPQLIYNIKSSTEARSMPVCQYPQYPRYKGSGDVNQASSYTCS